MADFEIYSSPGNRSLASPARTLNEQSLNRYDVDFYRRKAERLEEDLLTITEELNKARLRLRSAEDYQIKYDLMLKQKCSLEQEIVGKEKYLLELIAKNQEMAMMVRQRGAKSEEGKYEKEHLLKEIEVLKDKVLQAEDRARVSIAEEKNKASETIQKQLVAIKRNFGQAEQQYKYQIERLSKQLKEKQQVDTTVYSRHNKLSKEKQGEIGRLQGIIQKNREDYLDMLTEKNKEIQSVKNKFQQLLEGELGSIQKNMNSQDSKFKSELDGLRNIIALKNAEIDNLQNQLKISLEDSTNERNELNDEIKLLKAQIYQRDRENGEELFNMKERLTSLHAADIDAMQTHYDQLVQNLKDERRELQKLMSEKDRKVEHQRQQFQRGREQLRLIIAEREHTIEDLKRRLSLSGDSSNSEVGNLQQTLTKFANEKESMSNEYKANLAFLNQQISKLTSSNELKNNQIRELHEYNALLKKEQFQHIKDLEGKWKQERKERESEREKERDLREKVEEDYRQKQKIWKNKERQLQMDFEKQRRQKNKWVANSQKLQKQIERLYKQISDLQQNCKNEFSKSQNVVISGGGSKRELVNELERQKADFQAMKRMEIDQVKKKYELELIRLTNLSERLQNELTAKKIDYQKLEDQFKKISSQYRNIEKINKDKMSDYHKKMAALSSEILLTQNLYQSLVSAKSKVVRKE